MGCFLASASADIAREQQAATADLEAVFGERRQASRMVEMRVRERHPINFLGRVGQSPVIERLERARSLEQPAIDQQLATIMGDFDARSGDRAGGAVKAEFDRHGTFGRVARGKAYS